MPTIYVLSKNKKEKNVCSCKPQFYFIRGCTLHGQASMMIFRVCMAFSLPMLLHVSVTTAARYKDCISHLVTAKQGVVIPGITHTSDNISRCFKQI